VTEIILTNDQMQLFSNATDGVVIADSQGNVIVRVPPKISDVEATIINEAKQRLASDQPRVPFSDVLKRLKERERKEEQGRQ